MIEFTWVDLVIALVFAISTLIGVYRGIMREMLSVVVWTIAFILAIIHGKTAGELFTFLDSAGAKKTAGMVLIFSSVIIIGFIVKHFVFRSKGLGKPSGLDRFLGAMFGIARAVLVVVIALTLVSPTNLDNQTAFEKSILAPEFKSMVELMSVKMPPKWQRKDTSTASPTNDAATTIESQLAPLMKLDPNSGAVVPTPVEPASDDSTSSDQPVY